MRDELGQFVKGHQVPDEWKEKYSLANKDKPNIKNSTRKRTPKEFERLRKQGFRKGCVPHNKNNGRLKFNCIICGKEVLDKPYRRKKTCSYDCRTILSHIMCGKNHWNYKGENNNLQRNWSEYREWHREVLKRDNYTCQICGERGGRLQAHHIKSFSKYPKLRFDVNNGMVVHKECHLEKLHNWSINTNTWKRAALSTW